MGVGESSSLVDPEINVTRTAAFDPAFHRRPQEAARALWPRCGYCPSIRFAAVTLWLTREISCAVKASGKPELARWDRRPESRRRLTGRQGTVPRR